MGLGDKFKKFVKDAAEEVEQKTSDKLMEEEMHPTLRQHHGEPINKPKDKK